ncbi:MAG: hypothetical protein LBV74_03350 [Tannerella sp.]|jgi:hypothetical protein|nr:hypothetical protein [Tannerella sp.]
MYQFSLIFPFQITAFETLKPGSMLASFQFCGGGCGKCLIYNGLEQFPEVSGVIFTCILVATDTSAVVFFMFTLESAVSPLGKTYRKIIKRIYALVTIEDDDEDDIPDKIRAAADISPDVASIAKLNATIERFNNVFAMHHEKWTTKPVKPVNPASLGDGIINIKQKKEVELN